MARPIRVLRVIARMNMGGPAYHVALLSGRLDPQRYETVLATGDVGPGEESMESIADRYGVRLHKVGGLGPELRPHRDAAALARLIGLVRSFRPDIVHTHTAKAGMLGRIAARLAGGRRPVVIHTYHGHVLSGYFGRELTSFYRGLERSLARVSDCLLGVSQATVDELVGMGIAPPDKFRAISLGLELDRFAQLDRAEGIGFRTEIGATDEEAVCTFVGRLVPIKRLDVLIDAFAQARSEGAPVRLAIVGDGELRSSLEEHALRSGHGEAIRFLGYRTDLTAIAAGSDLAVLTSDNEGTPVALIEAAAAGLPCVATRVGGVEEVVIDGTGLLSNPGDMAGLGRAIAKLASDAEMRRRMGKTAQAHALNRYRAERLIGDIDRLYLELLATRAANGERISPVTGGFLRSAAVTKAFPESRPCPLCEGRATAPAYPYETEWEGTVHRYLRCGECGAAFVDPAPSPEVLERIYDWGNYHEVHYVADAAMRHIHCMTLLRKQLAPGARVLDFGCGTGDFMLLARDAGFEAHGVEYAMSAIQGARERTGLPVTDLEGAEATGTRFDAIHVCDVVHHLTEPAAICRRLEHLLAPNGVLLFSGPLEDNASLVRWAALAAGRLRRHYSLAHAAPTMLVRTDRAAQQRFFRDSLGYRELAFEIYETGWPYRLPEGPPDHSPRSLARHMIGSAAIAIARLLRPLRLGNRFTALYQVGTQ